MTLTLNSPAFQEGESIPNKYTCDGENVSPPLSWSGAPEEAESLVLFVDDPDAPSGTFVHWVLFNIPADLDSLAEGDSGGGIQGRTSFRQQSYGGPCPPRGSEHRYFFKLYALGASLELQPSVTKAEVEAAMRGQVLAQGQLIGVYSR